VPVLYVSGAQINFMFPSDFAEGTVEVVVAHAQGRSTPARIALTALAPGIFFDTATNFGAVLKAGASQTTNVQPPAAGEFIEIYCTGLGAVASTGSQRATTAAPQVLLDGVPVAVSFSGLASGYDGLYQVNAKIPDGATAGQHTLAVVVNGNRSNEVQITLR
jgi:uncharacterized protein (TIGR03437 family)